MDEKALITISSIDASVTELAFLDAQAIAAVFAVVDPAGVIAVFILLRLRDEVAILRFAAAVGVFRIDVHVRIYERVEVRDFIT